MFEGSNVSIASLCVCVSGSNVSNSMQPHGLQSPSLLGPWNSLGKNPGVGSHSHLLDLPDPQIQPRLPVLQADSSPSEPPGKSHSLFGFWIFFYFIFLVVAILVGIFVFSSMTNDVEHFVMCLLVIYSYALEECLIKFCVYVLVGLFAFLLLSFKCSLYGLDTRPLSDKGFVNIFSHFVGCLLSFLTMSFDAQKFLI